MNISKTASTQGLELYHAIWELVGVTFFDKSRLANWSSWEHKFDDLIDSEETALRCADEMLASLNDTYTERLIAPSTFVSPSSADESPAAGNNLTAAEKPADVISALSPSKLGYLRISSFDREDIVELVEAAVAKIATCEGVILDLRGNSGGRMHQAMECCGFFLDQGLLATLKFRHEEGMKIRQYFLNEDQFFLTDEVHGATSDGIVTTLPTDLYKRRAATLFGKPLVILLNRRTASASEMMICALVQNGIAGQVHMVGSAATAGKGIGQADYEAGNGQVKLRVTRCHWFAPGGEWLGDCGQTERNGIDPETLVDGDTGPEALKVAADELRKMLTAHEASSAATSPQESAATSNAVGDAPSAVPANAN
jgi:C-terminal processing protease CtpA/Prc